MIDKKILKKRRKIIQPNRREKTQNKDRLLYGVSDCSTYSMDHTLNTIIANHLYHFIYRAGNNVVINNLEEIEEHADNIMRYAQEFDSWDTLKAADRDRRKKALLIQKEYKKSMKWLADNAPSLWW